VSNLRLNVISLEKKKRRVGEKGCLKKVESPTANGKRRKKNGVALGDEEMAIFLKKPKTIKQNNPRINMRPAKRLGRGTLREEGAERTGSGCSVRPS